MFILFIFIFIYIPISVSIYKEIYCNELTHVIMESGKPKICSMGQKARDPGKPM